MSLEDTIPQQVVQLVSTTPGTDLIIELQPGINRIGRQRSGNHIVLVSPQVSRFHAEIEVTPTSVIVRDLGSGNGSFVNGELVTERVVQPSDLVAFSDKFTFRVVVAEPHRTLRFAGTQLTPPPSEVQFKPATPIDPAARRLDPTGPPETNTEKVIGEDTQRGIGEGAEPLVTSHAPPVEALAGALQPDGRTPTSPTGIRVVTGDTSRNRDAGAAALARIATLDQAIGPLVSAAHTDDGPSSAERDRRAQAALFEVSKRCLAARSLAEVDALLIGVLEKVTTFDRGFIGYRLPTMEWKLIISPKGYRWPAPIVRDLIQHALTVRQPVFTSAGQVVAESAGNASDPSQAHQQLLVPIWNDETPVGLIFLVNARSSFDTALVDFLSQLAGIAGMALTLLARVEESDGDENASR